MNVFATFDYELCFGNRTGSAQKCILEPTQKLMELAKPYQAHFTFFVDVLYLMKLKEYSRIKSLDEEFKAIKHQLETLIRKGHDVQLHLHTHWINAKYDNGKWSLDYPRYRIHVFSDDEVEVIVNDSVNFLEELTDRKIFAFRAGGWCLQPFSKLKDAFLNKGIFLDSTVFYGGYNQTRTNLYDFRKSPDLEMWEFDDDPLQIVENGAFTELPISSSTVSPLFYWKRTLVTKLFPKAHAISGDGTFLRSNIFQVARLLLAPTYAVASCDDYRSSLLEETFNKFESTLKNNFVIIGHPKLMSPYSKSKLESFVSKTTQKGHRFTSIREIFDTAKSSVTGNSLSSDPYHK